MPLKTIDRSRILLGGLLLIAALVAGCATPEETGGGGDENPTPGDGKAPGDGDQPTDNDTNETGDGGGNATLEPREWSEVFRVPEGATGFNLNLTITPIGEGVTNATVRVLGPDGELAVEENVTWEEDAGGTVVNLTLSEADAGNLEQFESGRWSFSVWTPGRVLISSQVTFQGVEGGEA